MHGRDLAPCASLLEPTRNIHWKYCPFAGNCTTCCTSTENTLYYDGLLPGTCPFPTQHKPTMACMEDHCRQVVTFAYRIVVGRLFPWSYLYILWNGRRTRSELAELTGTSQLAAYFLLVVPSDSLGRHKKVKLLRLLQGSCFFVVFACIVELAYATSLFEYWVNGGTHELTTNYESSPGPCAAKWHVFCVCRIMFEVRCLLRNYSNG